MDFFAHLSMGFQIVLEPMNLIYVWIGVIIGTAIGVLPGLGISIQTSHYTLQNCILLPRLTQLQLNKPRRCMKRYARS